MSEINEDLTRGDIAKLGDGYYSDIAKKTDAGWCCIEKMGLNHAIRAGITWDWPGERWCYHNYRDAKAAFDNWQGTDGTEPEGWHRHPNTGRRVDADGKTYIRW